MRIGVFVCHCGLNIAGVVDVKALVDYAKGLEGVAYATDVRYACSESGLSEIVEAIKEHKLDRVVIAACTPKLHERTFMKTLERAGLNPYMLAIANIREQCSWVHSGMEANLKARDLVRMAVARARKLKPLSKVKIPVRREVLVIGGGVAGITAASILSKFTKVYLVERSPTIGGHMALLNEVFPTNDCSICILAPKMSEVWNDPNVEVITNAEVVELSGHVGNFRVKVVKKPRYVDESKCKGCIEYCSEVCPIWVEEEMRKAVFLPIPQALPLCACIDTDNCVGCMMCAEACPENAINFDQEAEEIELDVGAVIVATGFKVGRVGGKRVVTLMQLERLLSASGPTKGELLVDGKNPKRIAFVLCHGSRDVNGKKYCSRVCCLATLKNAFTIKRRYPETEIWIFYMDMRAYHEELYERVQRMGVRFVRGKPRVTEREDGVIVRFENTLDGRVEEEVFDLVVLATPMEGNPIGLGVAVDENGFVMPAHPKLRPAETNVRGIFVAGTASSPMDIRESVESAGLASAKALEIVMSDQIESDPYHSFVGEGCVGCGICAEVCEFRAIEIDGRARIDPSACVGCGVCVASCPKGAIDMNYFSDEAITAEIDALTEEKNADPLVLMFACRFCAYSALDLAGVMKVRYSSNVRTIMVPCSGRVRPEWIVRALKRGVDGVMVAGCRLGECHFGKGNYRAKVRVDAIREMLGEDAWRVKAIWRSAGEVEIAKDVDEFVEEVRRWRERSR